MVATDMIREQALSDAEALAPLIQPMLALHRQIVIWPSQGIIEAFTAGRFCRKGTTSACSLSASSLAELMMHFGKLLSHPNVGLVLNFEEDVITVGITHPDGYICSREEIEIRYREVVGSTHASAPRVLETDQETCIQDYFAKLVRDADRDQLLVKNPRAHFARAMKNAACSACRKLDVRRKHLDEVKYVLAAKGGAQGDDPLQALKNDGVEADPRKCSLSDLADHVSELAQLDLQGLMDAVHGRLQEFLSDELFWYFMEAKRDSIDGKFNGSATARRLGKSVPTLTLKIRTIVSVVGAYLAAARCD